MTQAATRPTNGKHNGHNGKSRHAGESDSLSNFVFGKVQPQATDLEEAVLGALMLDREIIDAIAEILRPKSFYIEAHQHIFSAVTRLHDRGDPVDILTVTEELKRMGELDSVGGGYYLVELSNRVASAANTEYHARIIAQKYIQRELIAVSTRTIRDAYEDTEDVFNLQDRAESETLAIRDFGASGIQGTQQLVMAVLANLEKRASLPSGVTGVHSGLKDWDAFTGGFQDTDLIIIAARPGMGKTGLAISVTLNAATKHDEPIGFFSLEMSAEQIITRMVSMQSGVNSSKFRQADKLQAHEWQAIQPASEVIINAPIYIDDTAAISIGDLRAKARKMKKKHGVRMIIVDYLQLMTSGRDGAKSWNLDEETGKITGGLKSLAKELKIPVIALSQLSRAVEVRGGSKRPQLSDLRNSGNIEQDADVVAFIYRPEYYEILEDEMGKSLVGVAEIINAKNRHGPIDTIQVAFDAPQTLFRDIGAQPPQAPNYPPPTDFTEARPNRNEEVDFGNFATGSVNSQQKAPF